MFPTCSDSPPLKIQQHHFSNILPVLCSLKDCSTHTLPQTASCFQLSDSVCLRYQSTESLCLSLFQLIALFLFSSFPDKKMSWPCAFYWTTRGMCVCVFLHMLLIPQAHCRPPCQSGHWSWFTLHLFMITSTNKSRFSPSHHQNIEGKQATIEMWRREGIWGATAAIFLLRTNKLINVLDLQPTAVNRHWQRSQTDSRTFLWTISLLTFYEVLSQNLHSQYFIKSRGTVWMANLLWCCSVSGKHLEKRSL